jgi:hypothetical protein
MRWRAESRLPPSWLRPPAPPNRRRASRTRDPYSAPAARTAARRRVRVMGRRTTIGAHARHRRTGLLHSSELNASALRIREPSRSATRIPNAGRACWPPLPAARVATPAWFRLRFANGLAGSHQNAHRRRRWWSDPGIRLPNIGTSRPTNVLKALGRLIQTDGNLFGSHPFGAHVPGPLEAV